MIKGNELYVLINYPILTVCLSEQNIFRIDKIFKFNRTLRDLYWGNCQVGSYISDPSLRDSEIIFNGTNFEMKVPA